MLDMTVAVTEEGKITTNAKNRIRDVLLFRFAGRRARIRVTEEKRSGKQNAFYWGVVIGTIHRAMLLTGTAQYTVAETGEIVTTSPEDIHVQLKREYLPPRIANVLERVRVLPPTTTTLTVDGMTDYIDAILSDERVRRLLAHAGLDVPTTEDYQEENGRFRSGKIAEKMT